MRIGRKVEPRWSSFQPRQRDQLDRIEADGPEPDRLDDGRGNDVLGHRLHQAQHLDELTLAAVAHARLQEVTQVLERLGQIPALKRRRLVEGVRLGLDQRQVMQRIGHEHASAIAARVPGDLDARTQDRDLLDEALHQHVPEAVGRRHRVVVAAVANQRGRGDPPSPLLARLQRDCRQGTQNCTIGDESRADTLGMPSGPLILPGPAASLQIGVQRLEGGRHRRRGHEVGPGVFDQALDLTLVVALAWTPEAVPEQVMAHQLGEGAGAFALASAADLGDRDPGVVVEDRQRHALEEPHGGDMPVEERLGGLPRIRLHEAGVGVRQVHAEEMDLATHAADRGHRLAEVDLGMAGRVGQRHEGLPPLRPADPHVVLHHRVAAGIAVLVA